MNNILIRAIKYASKANLIKLTAYFLSIYIAKNNAKIKNKIVVLCLTRARNENDILALTKFEKRFSFISLPFNILKVAQYWLPKLDQTFYQKEIYLNSEAVLKSNELVSQTIIYLRKSGFNVQVAMSANFDYYQDFAFKNCPLIKYVGLSREHYIIKSSFNTGLGRYKDNYKFKGDRIFVFGSKTKQLLIESNVCSDEKIVITGCPRMDLILDMEDVLESEKTITLISFIDGNYGADKCFFEILESFKDLSKRYPLQKFLVKCKSTLDYNIISPLLIGYGIEVSYKIDFISLFKKAKIIISFNSNSIAEALLTNATIVIPYWAETRKNSTDLLVDPISVTYPVFEFANNITEFNNIVEKTIGGSEYDSNLSRIDRLKVLNDYFFVGDSLASTNVGDHLIQMLDESK